MKKIKWLILVLLLIISIGLYFGCGKNQVEPVQKTQTGSVSGYVYDASTYNYLTRTFSGIPDVQVIATSAGGTSNQSYTATTNSDGYYLLNNLPIGEISITAYKYTFPSKTIITDRAVINFLLSEPILQSGSGNATLEGTVSELPQNVGVVFSGAPLYYTAYSKSQFSPKNTFMISFTDNTYSIPSSPDDGETYLIASYLSQEASRSVMEYAYNKGVSAPWQTTLLDIQFGNYNTLSGTLSVPNGFISSNINCYLYKGSNIFGMRGSLGAFNNTFHSNSFQIGGLPPLLTGDAYTLEVPLTSDAGSIVKYFYGYNGTIANLNLDLSTLTVPAPVSSSPGNNAVITGDPTFSWNAVPGDNIYYVVDVVGGSTILSNITWSGITTRTSITCPLSLINRDFLGSGYTYHWKVSCFSYSSSLNLNDLPGSKFTSASGDLAENFMTQTKERVFSY